MARRSIPWILAFGFVLAGCQPAEVEEAVEEIAPAQMEAVAPAMDELEAAFVAAYDAQDAAGLAALFTDDGTQSPPLSPMLDKAGIEAAYVEQFAAGPAIALAVERQGMVTSGGTTVAWGYFTLTAEGDEEPTATGRYGVRCAQQDDGSWKIAGHMWNYELPPPGFGQMEAME
jgi:ketosteroid isomerase-like protein